MDMSIFLDTCPSTESVEDKVNELFEEHKYNFLACTCLKDEELVNQSYDVVDALLLYSFFKDQEVYKKFTEMSYRSVDDLIDSKNIDSLLIAYTNYTKSNSYKDLQDMLISKPSSNVFNNEFTVSYLNYKNYIEPEGCFDVDVDMLNTLMSLTHEGVRVVMDKNDIRYNPTLKSKLLRLQEICTLLLNLITDVKTFIKTYFKIDLNSTKKKYVGMINREAISNSYNRLNSMLERINKDSNLSQEEVNFYQSYVGELTRRHNIIINGGYLDPFNFSKEDIDNTKDVISKCLRTMNMRYRLF